MAAVPLAAIYDVQLVEPVATQHQAALVDSAVPGDRSLVPMVV
jgi:hypothetical protein